VSGTLSLGVKRPGNETDHSPPFTAEVKNDGAIFPLPHVFMAQWLINQAQRQIYRFIYLIYYDIFAQNKNCGARKTAVESEWS
jgi:hypothetical protein